MDSKKQKPMNQYFEIATCMGITDWYLERNILGKAFWAVLVVAGLSVTTMQTYLTVNQFITRAPYETTVSQEKVNDGIPFPSVTVCNINRAKQSLIESTKIDPKVLIYLFQLFPVMYELPLWLYRGNESLDVYEEALKNYEATHGKIEFMKIIRNFGHTAKETFVTINAGGRLMSPNDAVPVFTFYGLCWKLMPTFRQTVPGN